MKSQSDRVFEAMKERRKELARAPIAVKLAKLDALRDRAASIRSEKTQLAKTGVRESGEKVRGQPSP